MNFLAHIYLSGDDDPLLTIGNCIGDTVRGNQYKEYPEALQRGILLHRRIDTFTDVHPVFRQSKRRLVPRFNHYAGVIVDIFYDYLLAKHFGEYSPISLHDFALRFYTSVQQNCQLLQPEAQHLLHYMLRDNWLERYATVEGITRTFHQMDARTDFKSGMQHAPEVLFAEEEAFEAEFRVFFEEVRGGVKLK